MFELNNKFSGKLFSEYLVKELSFPKYLNINKIQEYTQVGIWKTCEEYFSWLDFSFFCLFFLTSRHSAALH